VDHVIRGEKDVVRIRRDIDELPQNAYVQIF